MNDDNGTQSLAWGLAAQFVEEHGHLDEGEFGQGVVDFINQHPELDPGNLWTCQSTCIFGEGRAIAATDTTPGQRPVSRLFTS